ncbi:phosphotransferase family protein [Tsukamurella paurometabola]|uniref:Phosphotransferase enzyme family n=1 Tax=Tsukamurella paurometabola TaxID=2061 RepID=A0A3P8KKF7_TSUPA|nr:phosphotransferase [Tsukamurella paurometabola]UEA83934.1 phosphotransferase [Tsukamurella paurometabola]VDR41088.1 Phosphotransferase enzyme family [Tsukamurella paurometabola]
MTTTTKEPTVTMTEPSTDDLAQWWPDTGCALPQPVMASPSWWGADSRRWSVPLPFPGSPAAGGCHVKVLEPHTAAYVDVTTSFAAAVAAGKAGIGPRVHHADPSERILITEDYTDRAHTANLDLFDAPDRLGRLIEVRRAVHRLPPTGRSATVFDDIRTAAAAASRAGAALPADLPWMLRLLNRAESAITAAGFDRVPIHGDANVSNVLVTDDGGLLLVDFDCAADADPLQDIGSMLAELAPLESDAEALFERAWGAFDRAAFARARAYGIADQVRWGLIGSYCDAVRPATQEYSKFADWQFLRARAQLRDPRFDDQVRSV